MKDGYYRFKSERSMTKCIAQLVRDRWFLIGEELPVTMEELKRRGWELDSRVGKMKL